jgi:hypothetical protein
VASPVPLFQLIQRVRQRYGGEGATGNITDWEITDCINVSWATELYDVVRASVGDKYYEAPFVIQLQSSVAQYDLPADFLALLSLDVWLGTPGTPGSSQLKINGMRYMEYERNMYQQILVGWNQGATVLYTLIGSSSIRFQPTPTQALYVQLNYVPVAPRLGGGPNMSPATLSTLTTPYYPAGVPQQPQNYNDVFDDINGWAEVVVLDAARKCCLKLNRLDMVQALAAERDALRKRIESVVPLRHAGEPERVNFPQARLFGDGWLE